MSDPEVVGSIRNLLIPIVGPDVMWYEKLMKALWIASKGPMGEGGG